MGQFFRLVTRWTPAEIAVLEKGLAETKLHPRDVKMKLAREIVSIYYSQVEAAASEENFIRLFQQGSFPEELPVFHPSPGQTVLDALVESQLVMSRSEGRRLCAQKGVRLDDQMLKTQAKLQRGGVLQAGKRRFVKVVIDNLD
jgi:tyrosyl-tRNA synthetase